MSVESFNYSRDIDAKCVISFLDSNLLNQRGNIEKRDVGDSAGVSSRLSDMQNAIESLTHSVNNVATKQQVRTEIVQLFLASYTLSFSSKEKLLLAWCISRQLYRVDYRSRSRHAFYLPPAPLAAIAKVTPKTE